MTDKKMTQFHTSLNKGGKRQTYDDPDDLLSKAFEYFAWCSENPWQKKELMRSGERKGEMVDTPVSRPFTLAGLCVYCGISEKTFGSYLRMDNMQDAALHILGIIRQNQEEGAITGMYNSAFVLRLLDQTGDQMAAIEEHQPVVINITDPAGKEIIETFIDKVRKGTKGA